MGYRHKLVVSSTSAKVGQNYMECKSYCVPGWCCLSWWSTAATIPCRSPGTVIFSELSDCLRFLFRWSSGSIFLQSKIINKFNSGTYISVHYSTLRLLSVQYSTVQHSTALYNETVYGALLSVQYIKYSTVQYIKYSTVQDNETVYGTLQIQYIIAYDYSNIRLFL